MKTTIQKQESLHAELTKIKLGCLIKLKSLDGEIKYLEDKLTEYYTPKVHVNLKNLGNELEHYDMIAA